MNPAQLKTYVKNSLLGQKLYQKVIGKVDPDRGPDAGLLQRQQGAVRPAGDAHRAPRPGQDQGRGRSRCGPCSPPTTPTPTGPRWPRSTRSTRAPRTAAAASGPSSAGQMVKPFDERRLRAQGQHRLGAGQEQYGWHVIEVTKITPAKKSHLRERQGADQEHADQPDAAEDLAGLAGQAATKAADIKYAAGFDPDQLTAVAERRRRRPRRPSKAGAARRAGRRRRHEHPAAVHRRRRRTGARSFAAGAGRRRRRVRPARPAGRPHRPHRRGATACRRPARSSVDDVPAVCERGADGNGHRVHRRRAAGRRWRARCGRGAGARVRAARDRARRARPSTTASSARS